MARKMRRLYTASKRKWQQGRFQTVYGENETLFSEGIYPTKLTAEDMPEWYVYGRYYKQWGYLSAKGVKSLVYEPNRFSNHMFKDDFLYISYSDPIVLASDRQPGGFKYTGFDEYIFGSVIVRFLRAAERYSDYDITVIKAQIEEKRLWFKESYPEDYALEVPMDRPYFDAPEVECEG